MQTLSIRPQGWHFAITFPNGATENHSLATLDRRFDLGLRGNVWEVSALARRVALVTASPVQVYFDGWLMASADPPAY